MAGLARPGRLDESPVAGHRALLVIRATGSGWVAPPVESFEYLTGGDSASMALTPAASRSPLRRIVTPFWTSLVETEPVEPERLVATGWTRRIGIVRPAGRDASVSSPRSGVGGAP